ADKDRAHGTPDGGSLREHSRTSRRARMGTAPRPHPDRARQASLDRDARRIVVRPFARERVTGRAHQTREGLLMPGPEGTARRQEVEAAAWSLEDAIAAAAAALIRQQRADGHWAFALEADVTIPAEYIALQHFLGESTPELEAKIATYLRRRQATHGGWPLL